MFNYYKYIPNYYKTMATNRDDNMPLPGRKVIAFNPKNLSESMGIVQEQVERTEAIADGIYPHVLKIVGKDSEEGKALVSYWEGFQRGQQQEPDGYLGCLSVWLQRLAVANERLNQLYLNINRLVG
jgi:hypothetical protein